MSRPFCLLAGLFALTLSLVGEARAASLPIFEYRFNDSGTSTSSSGTNTASASLLNSSATATDLHGGAGTGVSGLTGDNSFNNSASTGMGSAGTGGVARQSGPQAATDNLISFTVTGWFKPESVAINNSASLVSNLSGGGFSLRANTIAGQLLFETANGSVTSTGSSYGAVGSWTFFAVTYDGTTSSNNVIFYQGSTAAAATAVTTIGMTGGSIGTSTNPLSMGNSNINNRPYDGSLDDIRLFGATSGTAGVLTLGEINTIRTNDLANVPEPSMTVTLLGMTIALAMARRRNSAARQR
jgi:hypothetical protein